MDVGSVIVAFLVASGACETRCEADLSLDRFAAAAAQVEPEQDAAALAVQDPAERGAGPSPQSARPPD